ncbi:MAG: peptidase M15 [Bacteroidetes bacterium]|nr:MAG: peptidase M15 [Bacteroidota bacterium]
MLKCLIIFCLTTTAAFLQAQDYETRFINFGLINIHELDEDIVVELKYSTTDNFLHTDLYGNLTEAYLQPDVAEKLVLAQALLQSKFPYYTLVILDAARPVEVQQKMWEFMSDYPVQERTKYVSNPKNGSLHNFGAAVDVTIKDLNGGYLDMGTPYDYFGELAYPRLEKHFLETGELTPEQYQNRLLLRNVMQAAGFSGISTEWWHFNSCSREEAKLKYRIIP